MPLFHVRFPERVVNPQKRSSGSCGMASCHICMPADVERGVSTTVEATDRRDAWDKCHRSWPFEKIEVG